MSSTITIKIRTRTTGIISLKINTTDTVEFIKLEIEKRTSIAVIKQRLLYRGRELNNDKPINDYGVVDGSIIQLAVIKSIMSVSHDIESEYIEIKTEAKTIELFIKTPAKIISMIAKFDKYIKIGDIKSEIKSKEGIPINQQRLIFDGQQLDNERHCEYEIFNKSTLILVIIDQNSKNVASYNKKNEYLTYGFVKESFDGDIPTGIIWIFMDYLQYLVEQWDPKTVSSNVEINGSIIKGKKEINNFEKVYGILDLKDNSKGIIVWKLQVVNVKFKSIGAYAYIGIDKYNYCGYSGNHKPRGSRSYHDTRFRTMGAVPYGGHLKIGDVIQVCCNLEKLQISFIINDKDLGIAYENIKLSSIKLSVSVRYHETEIQLLGVDFK